MTKNIGKNFLKCLICFSSHSQRITNLCEVLFGYVDKKWYICRLHLTFEI